jgi:tripartite-type tricarboxylate transporter receptor subunit TctC
MSQRKATRSSVVENRKSPFVIRMTLRFLIATTRRLRETAACLTLVLASFGATAEGVVRIVVPAPPGGGLDATARALVARAPADGKTILYSGTAIVMNPWLQKLGPSPVTELHPVLYLSNSEYVLVASAGGAIRSIADLQAHAASPAGLSCAAPPGPMQLACEQLRTRLPSVVVVPYLGIAPAVGALLGGHVDAMFVNLEGIESLLRAGSVRAIAASAPSAASGVPLIAQVWPGLYLDGFTGVFVPARTPPEKVRELNEAMNRVLAQPAFRKFMADTRQEIIGGSPEQFARKISTAYDRYGEVIRKANLAIDGPAATSKTHTP